jgi:valyl-tRNA synthetase
MTQELAKTYEPSPIESRIYQRWLALKCFESHPDERPSYSIVIPPPNVTGVLHMGHMLNNTIQDVLIRRARMRGYNTCWVPGTDHASIATEAKVVQKLRDQGIKKGDLSREAFLEHAWEWTYKHGGIILEQLKRLGASCDWSRTRFTMEPSLSDAVIDVFIDLHKKGYIYRGNRIVNWDPKALTAVSDEEVIYKETSSQLYYVRYRLHGSQDEWITIATTRPETIPADTAVCVNPEDPRYQALVGRMVEIPFTQRIVPVISDAYVDADYGTGALKVTPAHDANDYDLGVRHQLELIDMFHPDGSLNAHGGKWEGLDRLVARKQMAAALEEMGHLVKTEELKSNVGYSERTNEIIEPRLSLQWFCKMDQLAKPALDAVLTDEIQIYPEKFKNTYRHWMENIRDWCISRQLWWGHRIPAWYDQDGDVVVAKTEEEAREQFKQLKPHQPLTQLKQDEDVLDTWFSSWLWPISVFDGFKDPNNADLSYYYPTKILVTAPEILFFWVARMIIAGYEWKKEKPFDAVYLHGIVRDKQGRKMSKSLGNSPDPLQLIDTFGADGVRMGMLLSAPAGNDILFDESLCEQGRNFANKIWNAYRLLKSWTVDPQTAPTAQATQAAAWFDAHLNQQLQLLDEQFESLRLSEALMSVYKLFWDDFCSWYLELVKPAYGQAMSAETYEHTLRHFEALLRLLHPFMPFITEELWLHLAPRTAEDTILNTSWPKSTTYDAKQITRFEQLRDIVATVRAIRSEMQVQANAEVQLHLHTEDAQTATDLMAMEPLFRKVLKLSSFEAGNLEQKPAKAASGIAGRVTVYLPLAGLIDVDKELERVNKEIERLSGFLQGINAKLSNEKFVSGAPESVIANERQKQADTEAKLERLIEIRTQLKE